MKRPDSKGTVSRARRHVVVSSLGLQGLSCIPKDQEHTGGMAMSIKASGPPLSPSESRYCMDFLYSFHKWQLHSYSLFRPKTSESFFSPLNFLFIKKKPQLISNHSLHSIPFSSSFRCTAKWLGNHALYRGPLASATAPSTHLAPYPVSCTFLILSLVHP